jgi:hypothetical protein
MNSELLKRREELKQKFERTFNAHCQKHCQHNASESAYRDSSKKNYEIYQELFDVCQELGDPIPVWLYPKKGY